MTQEELTARLAALDAGMTSLTAENVSLRQQVSMLMQSHQTAHQELQALRERNNRPSPRKLVDPKAMTPGVFGGVSGPAWRTWSYKAKNFASIADPNLKRILSDIEVSKDSVTADDFERLGITAEVDAELSQFLINRTEGEAADLVRGADKGPGIEMWRILVSRYDPMASSRSLAESRSLLNPARAARLEQLSAVIQGWENLERRRIDRTGESIPADMRLSLLLAMCPLELEKELVAQQHLFPTTTP